MHWSTSTPACFQTLLAHALALVAAPESALPHLARWGVAHLSRGAKDGGFDSSSAGGSPSIWPKVFPEEFLCATRGAKDAGLPGQYVCTPLTGAANCLHAPNRGCQLTARPLPRLRCSWTPPHQREAP